MVSVSLFTPLLTSPTLSSVNISYQSLLPLSGLPQFSPPKDYDVFSMDGIFSRSSDRSDLVEFDFNNATFFAALLDLLLCFSINSEAPLGLFLVDLNSFFGIPKAVLCSSADFSMVSTCSLYSHTFSID